jgi:two-component system, NtrC family, sensor kinase
VIRRTRVQPFTAKQVALLKTFADQAAIVIENLRLSTELQEKNRALTQAHAQVTEALDRQTATSEILRVMSRSPTDVQPVFETIVHNALRLCGAAQGGAYRFDGRLVHSVAHAGYTPEQEASWRRTWPRPASAPSLACHAIKTNTVVRIDDIEVAADFADMTPETWANLRERGSRSFIAVPMRRGDEVIGAISLAHSQTGGFSAAHEVLLATFADQAVIAIENVRLFKTKEALEQQTATAEILRVISRSPTDVQPVLDMMAESAARLCGAYDASVVRLDGEVLRRVAHHGPIPAGFVISACDRGTVTGRAMVDRQQIHVADLQAETVEFPEGSRFARQSGTRSLLSVPLVREGVAIGAINIRRTEVQPFTDSEIALLQTFADQAVIAIENVRLFTELQEKNRALAQAHTQMTETLEQQTATAEILRVISSSPTSLQPVLDAVAENAARVCEGQDASVVLVDGASLRRVAHTRGIPATAGDVYTLRRDTVMGRAVIDCRTIHVEDLLALPKEYPEGARLAAELGHRTTLATPLLREGEAIGALLIRRLDVRPFTDAQVTLLETFAAQAVIAIENVRLFNELGAANRDLKAASQHKSEFLANMSHELRTPLNAIIGFSEVLGERMFGELNEKQDEYLKDIHASGQHLLSLINDILDLSKIEAGRMELELAEFHLPQAIENALVLVRERALRRGITLEQSIDQRLGQIQGDERKIKQVLLNLLSNAIKFTPEGGRIDIRAVPVDGSAEVSVTDTGVGIAPEDQEAIFEEFRQVGTADKKVEGTGLGLALSRKFIELHGGRIWVESQVGVGSTFTFTIPIRTGA